MKSAAEVVKEKVAAFNQAKEKEIAKANAKIAETEAKILQAEKEKKEAEIEADFDKAFSSDKKIEDLKKEKAFYENTVKRINDTVFISEDVFKQYERDLKKDYDRIEKEATKKGLKLIDEIMALIDEYFGKQDEINEAWRIAKDASELVRNGYESTLPGTGNSFVRYLANTDSRNWRNSSELNKYRESV